MNVDFTFVDILVILTLVVSIVYAAARGFVNETLSVVAWAAAAFATLYFAPSLAPYLRARLSPVTGTLLAYGGIFLVVLIPLSFVSYRFSENVRNSEVGVIDRALGVVFGIVRGLAVVGIAYLVFSMIVPVRDHPRFIRDARFLPLIRGSAEVLLAIVPDQHLDETTDDDISFGPRHIAKKTNAHHTRKAYGAEDRRGLERLIQATGNSEP